MATLHYDFDPYCGWCYGAAPLLAAALELPGLTLELHAGGMLTGTHRRLVSPQWRDYVLAQDRRIARLTGQPFGAAYADGLLAGSDTVLDSGPPSAAILAAQFLAGRGAALLAALQRAHFVDGLRITEPDVQLAAAQGVGLEPAAYMRALRAWGPPALERHFRDSAQWLARCGGQGYPSFALDDGTGPVRLEHARFLGAPDAWREALAARLASTAATV